MKIEMIKHCLLINTPLIVIVFAIEIL
jgi:hypothetical protein